MQYEHDEKEATILGKYLQIICLVRDYYPEYIEKVQNSVTKPDNPKPKWAKDLNRHFFKFV
jgi:hypothetical protein